MRGGGRANHPLYLYNTTLLWEVGEGQTIHCIYTWEVGEGQTTHYIYTTQLCSEGWGKGKPSIVFIQLNSALRGGGRANHPLYLYNSTLLWEVGEGQTTHYIYTTQLCSERWGKGKPSIVFIHERCGKGKPPIIFIQLNSALRGGGRANHPLYLYNSTLLWGVGEGQTLLSPLQFSKVGASAPCPPCSDITGVGGGLWVTLQWTVYTLRGDFGVALQWTVYTLWGDFGVTLKWTVYTLRGDFGWPWSGQYIPSAVTLGWPWSGQYIPSGVTLGWPWSGQYIPSGVTLGDLEVDSIYPQGWLWVTLKWTVYTLRGDFGWPWSGQYIPSGLCNALDSGGSFPISIFTFLSSLPWGRILLWSEPGECPEGFVLTFLSTCFDPGKIG